MGDKLKSRRLPWACLACIAIVYAISVFRFNPANFFGITQDDSIYLSSAKALASHQGYILPSVPGNPAATKYPILYPWILSLVWRVNPNFPSNLRDAVVVTVIFGMVFLTACFLFLRSLKGMGEPAALILTLFVALHPVVLFYSASVLSDIPFAALALGTLLIGDIAMRSEGTDGGAFRSGCLAGLSILLRIFGVPIAAGVLAAGIARRAWRQSIIFCGTLLPFCGAMLWRDVFSPHGVPAGPLGATGAIGFSTAWSYYTSYPGFWKLSIPNVHILWAMLQNNAIFMLHSPSDYFPLSLISRDSPAGRSLMVLVTAGIIASIVRQARESQWKAIHWALPFYAALALFWNYPDPNGRFFIPFLPLFAGGLWFEASHSLGLVTQAFTKSRARSEQIIAAVLGIGLAALLLSMTWNYVRGNRKTMVELGANRSILLQEKRDAYQWISSSTSPHDVVVAYEDASLYLYTGRQSMRPVVFTTAGLFDSAYLQDSIAHMGDVARTTHARYWLFADDDLALEGEAAMSLGRARESDLASKMRVVFQSRTGRVRIYAIGRGEDSKSRSCL